MTQRDSQGHWPDYAAVWRWHFYAGLFCLPFVCWLALTGTMYLFRPNIETWLDRPYENLEYHGARATPSREIEAAVSAVPGSTFSHYETPATATGAAQIVVSSGAHLTRVYVHPKSLAAMRVIRDDRRIMELVSQLHGTLLAGDKGSMVVELAASWTMVMLISGIYLWFPRSGSALAGVLYPRLKRGKRLFWRDLHAVTGMWVSLVALFMVSSGLPWAASWGNYLTWARNLSSVTAGTPDWPTGGATPEKASTMAGMSAEEMAAMSPSLVTQTPAIELTELDRVLPTVLRLNLPRPVWVLPPSQQGGDWVATSQTQTRPNRVKFTIEPRLGAITSRQDSSTRNILDRVVDVTTSIHEGQFFGVLNQVILALTAMGLVLLTVSSTVLWWRRRPEGTLGAPRPGSSPRVSLGLVAIIILLAIIVPLFGISFFTVLLIERLVLRRVPGVRRWLGLRASA